MGQLKCSDDRLLLDKAAIVLHTVWDYMGYKDPSVPSPYPTVKQETCDLLTSICVACESIESEAWNPWISHERPSLSHSRLRRPHCCTPLRHRRASSFRASGSSTGEPISTQPGNQEAR